MNYSKQQIDIGLLWNEVEIAGEIASDFDVVMQFVSGQTKCFAVRDERFYARAVLRRKSRTFGIRLEESLSEQRARDVLTRAQAVSDSFNGEVVAAGVNWEEGLDGRVWWPVLAAGTKSDAEELLNDLREKTELPPLPLSIVPLSERRDAPFEFIMGQERREVTSVRCFPRSSDSLFYLQNVPIGRGFHWQHKERLGYRGELHIFSSPEGGVTAANRLSLETYLRSTVFSEMGTDLPDAFLAAQAIAARSTVSATAGRHHRGDGFHLCNDDHCQCYQGISREPPEISPAIMETAGQILTCDGKPADARYAKSCGGVSETYEAVWGGEGPTYLISRPCGKFDAPDLKKEESVQAFLHQKPPAFCNDALYSYPERWREEKHFRWQRDYGASELQQIIENKTGIEVGTLRELRPLVRGRSGRILILEIVGSKRTLRVYRELEVRRVLSPSHLPSSCFIVESEGKGPERFRIVGGGWGHGVGLCQLGATAMANEDWNAERILEHFYPNTTISEL